MRPVNKPVPPQGQPVAGKGKSPWDVLQGALVDTIGDYCCFCEMPINVNFNIASKQNSKLIRSYADGFQWGDLLLACRWCQQYRRPGAVRVSDYLWPDQDPTFRVDAATPFRYVYQQVTVIQGGSSGSANIALVNVNPESPLAARAQRTLDLFQLNSPFYNAKTNTLTLAPENVNAAWDPRLSARTEAWLTAHEVLANLDKANRTGLSGVAEMVWRQAIALAQKTGFWSVWMTVFWQAYQNLTLLNQTLVETTDRKHVIIYGYQGLPTKQPPDSVEEPPPKRRRPNPPPVRTYTIFTGTDKSRIFD